MKILRKLLTSILAVSLCSFGAAEAAARTAAAEISWGNKAFCAMQARQEMLVDDEVLKQTAAIIDERLQVLQQQGELPFTLKISDDSFGEDKTADGNIAIIPLIMDDHCFKSEHTIEGTVYYKAVVMCRIDLAFCYHPGAGERLRLLQVVPLTGYSVLGDRGEYTSPLTQERLKAEFLADAKLLVDDLKFKNKKFMQDMDYKKSTTDTYQVTDVAISSAAAQKFYGTELTLVKSLLGAAFTSKFAALNPDKTVLPAMVGNDWEADAAKQTYQLSLGDTGKYITVERGSNEIKLDLIKLAVFDVPLKKDVGLYQKKGYAAELRNLSDGTKSVQFVERLLLPNDPDAVKYDRKGIFAELFIKVAEDLAQKQGSK